MKKSRACALGLACFLSATAAFSALAATSGGGALLRNLSDKNALSSASQAGQNATENLTPQEQLLAGTLELDPENDPVIFTTDYGLEIKSHNAGEAPISVNQSNGTITNASGTTWNYISAGGYNWIIIGQYSSSTYSFNPSPLAGNMYAGNNPDGTDAGNAIEGASENGLLQVGTITIPAFTNAAVPSNGEIPIGCVLCLSETEIGSPVQFNTSTSKGNNYKGSNLEKHINETIYDGESTLSIALQSLPIIPQTLTTMYYGSNISTIENAYLFPLAVESASESFRIQTYFQPGTSFGLDSQERWWTRSGYNTRSNSHSHYVIRHDYPNPDEENTYAGNVTSTDVYVRPAFVLRLYG